MDQQKQDELIDAFGSMAADFGVRHGLNGNDLSALLSGALMTVLREAPRRFTNGWVPELVARLMGLIDIPPET